MSLPPQPFASSEVKDSTKEVNAQKAPGFDLITGKNLGAIKTDILIITVIFNAVIRLEYIPSQWKVAQILKVLKPG